MQTFSPELQSLCFHHCPLYFLQTWPFSLQKILLSAYWKCENVKMLRYLEMFLPFLPGIRAVSVTEGGVYVRDVAGPGHMLQPLCFMALEARWNPLSPLLPPCLPKMCSLGKQDYLGFNKIKLWMQRGCFQLDRPRIAFTFYLSWCWKCFNVSSSFFYFSVNEIIRKEFSGLPARSQT